jgi:hypothetical protein
VLRPAEAFYLDQKTIGSVQASAAAPAGEFPPDAASGALPSWPTTVGDTWTSRPWHPVVYRWEASALCHQPLYFEDVNLERYGYTCRGLQFVQPVVSGAKFFATIPCMPYLATAKRPCQRIYTLGHYRPGSLVPFRHHCEELRLGPGAVQAAAVTAVVLAVP